MACIRKNGKPRPQWTPEASRKQSLRVIGHLDRSSVTEEEIRDTFSKYGTISDIMIMKDDDWEARPHLWWAYVQYNDNEAAVLAKDELNGKILGGECVSVECIRFDHTFARGCDTILVNYLDLSVVKGYKLLGFYKRFGSIRTFKLNMKRKGFNEGYAVIRYDKEKDAEVAVLNMVDNTFPYICRRERLKLMRERRSRSVCVTNLTMSDKTFHLRNAFEPYGTISKVNMVFDPYCEQSRCFAYVEFEKPEVASSAVGVQTSPNGNVWNVELASRKFEREAELRTTYEQADSTLYVKNLHLELREVDLRELFSKFGTVAYCKVVLGSDGMSMGFGFVAFSTHEEAIEAMEKMNGVTVSCKVLIICLASKKKNKNVFSFIFAFNSNRQTHMQ